MLVGAAGEKDRRGEALDVPLEGAADGFVEVVDVEDEAAVGAAVGAEVEQVGVAADLRHDAGVGVRGEVGGHDGHGAAKEAERRRGHALVFELDELRQAAAHAVVQDVERLVGAGGAVEGAVGGAGELFAGADAEGVALGAAERRDMGHRSSGCQTCTPNRWSSGRAEVYTFVFGDCFADGNDA